MPVGLIQRAWSGTPAEAWTSRPTLASNPALSPLISAYDQDMAAYRKAPRGVRASAGQRFSEKVRAASPGGTAAGFAETARDPHQPEQSRDAVQDDIAPLIPYAIRGVIWYQGESNTGTAYLYQTLFTAMIGNWQE